MGAPLGALRLNSLDVPIVIPSQHLAQIGMWAPLPGDAKNDSRMWNVFPYHYSTEGLNFMNVVWVVAARPQRALHFRLVVLYGRQVSAQGGACRERGD
jgi:hypothetical protein